MTKTTQTEAFEKWYNQDKAAVDKATWYISSAKEKGLLEEGALAFKKLQAREVKPLNGKLLDTLRKGVEK